MHTRLLAAALLKQSLLYTKLIEQGCEEGIFKCDTPHECTKFVLSAIQFLTNIGIYPWSQENLKRRQQAFPQLIEQLLHAPKGLFSFLTLK